MMAYQAFPADLSYRSVETSNTAYTGSSRSLCLMKKKLGHYALSISVLIIVIAAVSLPAHAQDVNWRLDKSAYAPGDSGTLTVTIINTSGNPLAIRNITVYYPWAGYDTNGKWLSNANISYDLSPFKALTTVGANNYSYTTPLFNIPSWWGINSPLQYGCPGSTNNRHGTYSGCILLGTNSTSKYDGTNFRVTMAQAFYNPSSLSTLSEWVPIASLVVLVIATAFLALAWASLRKLPKK